MPDYTQQRDFSAKDALSTGDSNKVAKGADIDDELARISTAIATKFDTDDTLLTEINVMTQDPGVDALMMWDESDNCTIWAVNATNGGIAFAGVTVKIDLNDLDTEITMASGDFIAMVDITDSASTKITLANFEAIVDHDALSNFVAGEHILHSGVSVIAGTGLTGGGTIDANRTLNVIGGDGITANANDIALTAAAASTTNPVAVAATISLDVEALTTIEGNALAATDTFYVEDGGVSKGIEYQGMGARVQSAQGNQTLAADDMNTIMEFDAAATITLPLNSGTPLPIGAAVLIVVDHASDQVTITAASSVTLNSIFHPGGATASDKVRAGGSALLIKTAADEWYLSGDTVT